MAASPRRRRSWPQRLVITFNVMCIVAALGKAGSLGYFNRQFSRIERIAVPAGVLDRGPELAGDTENYLLVGVDDASGVPEGDAVRTGRDGEFNSDTIMLLRVDPDKRTARLLSFPRDLWIPIAGTDSRRRINSALPSGGIVRLVDTIWENFRIPVHHFVQVDFAGFRNLVEVIDGVPVSFPEPARARSSGLAIPEAGCWILGPDQALGMTRARKDYEVFRDGEWVDDEGEDYARVDRQQLFIQLALKRAVAKGARNPNTLRRLVDLGVQTVSVDETLAAEDLVSIGSRFRSFNPDNLIKYTLPTEEVTRGAAQVLALRADEAEATLAVFRGIDPPAAPEGEPAAPDRPPQTTPSAAPPPSTATVAAADVTMTVLNGTGVNRQARTVASELAAVGFGARATGNDDGGPRTVVRHRPDTAAAARLVARHIGGPVTYSETSVPEGTDVVIVTGDDWIGTLPGPRPEAEVPGPATTVPPTIVPPTTVPPTIVPPTTVPPTTVPRSGSVDTGDQTALERRLSFLPTAPLPGADCRRTG